MNRFVLTHMKSHLAIVGWRRGNEFAHRGEKLRKVRIMAVHAALGFIQSAGNLEIRHCDFAQPNEGPHDAHAGSDGDFAIEHAGEHDDAVFRKHPRHVTASSTALL